MKRFAILLLSAAALGCPSEKATFPENPPAQKPPAQAATAAIESPNLPAEAQKQVNDGLDAYDDIRGALSNDQIEIIPASAARLEAAATSAASQAASPANARLTAIASTASRLKAAADLEQTRVAFAELSRSVVEFLENEPTLAQRRHLFTCPMTKGYSKWVQSTDAIGNPYMGRKMLACGEEQKWKS